MFYMFILFLFISFFSSLLLFCVPFSLLFLALPFFTILSSCSIHLVLPLPPRYFPSHFPIPPSPLSFWLLILLFFFLFLYILPLLLLFLVLLFLLLPLLFTLLVLLHPTTHPPPTTHPSPTHHPLLSPQSASS